MSETKDQKASWSITHLLLVALAIVPALFATGFTRFEYLKQALAIAILGVVMVGWGVAVIRGKTVDINAGRAATIAAVLGFFAVFATLWAPTHAIGLVGASYWMLLAGTFIAVVAPIGRPLSFRAVGIATALGTIAAAAVGLLDLAGVGLTTVVWDPPGAPGSFDAREFAVGYYVVALPLIAGTAVLEGGKGRIVSVIALVLGALHFGLVANPVALAALATGVALAGVLVQAVLKDSGKSSLAALGGAAAALVVALGVGFVAPEPGPPNEATDLPWIADEKRGDLPDRAEIHDPRYGIPRMEEIQSFDARAYLIGVAFDLVRDQPVVGHGPGGWWAQQTKFPRPEEDFVTQFHVSYPAFRSPHNAFALAMADLGGVGLFFLIALLFAVVSIGLTSFVGARDSEDADDGVRQAALMAAVVAGVIAATLTASFEHVASVLVFATAAGLLVRNAAPLNEYRGLSTKWVINPEGKRKWETTLICGLIPASVGALYVAAALIWGVASYYQSWGDLLMLRTKYEEAIDKYTLASDIVGPNGETLYNIALAHKRTGQMDQARDEVELALKQRPYDVRVINLVAGIYLYERDYAEAVRAARRAVSLFPNYHEGRRALAAALNLQGRVPEAVTELQTLLELDPPDEMKGRVHRELGGYYAGPLGKPAEAVKHYEKAFEFEKKDFIRAAIAKDLEEQKKVIERKRLEREGKPIPPELMPVQPKAAPGHEGHNH